MSNQFKLKDGVFYRTKDGKEIARLDDGEIVDLHHKQERFREELESLVFTVDPIEWEKEVEVSDEAKELLDETPRELFSKRMGDVTPEVISWRREHWGRDRFEAFYKERVEYDV